MTLCLDEGVCTSTPLVHFLLRCNHVDMKKYKHTDSKRYFNDKEIWGFHTEQYYIIMYIPIILAVMGVENSNFFPLFFNCAKRKTKL